MLLTGKYYVLDFGLSKIELLCGRFKNWPLSEFPLKWRNMDILSNSQAAIFSHLISFSSDAMVGSSSENEETIMWQMWTWIYYDVSSGKQEVYEISRTKTGLIISDSYGNRKKNNLHLLRQCPA